MKQEMIVKTGEDGRIYSQTPLVRCKDCKYVAMLNGSYYCDKPNEDRIRFKKPDWFCADGERKEESLHPIAPYLMVR